MKCRRCQNGHAINHAPFEEWFIVHMLELPWLTYVAPMVRVASL